MKTKPVALKDVHAGSVVLYDGQEYKAWKRVRVVDGGTMLLASPRGLYDWEVNAVALYYANAAARAVLVEDAR